MEEGGRRKRRGERKEENLKGMTDQKEKVENLRNEGISDSIRRKRSRMW